MYRGRAAAKLSAAIAFFIQLSKEHSAKLLAMPSRAETHIQNTAPGPLAAIASVTPARLPLPTRAARLVQSA